MLTSSNTGGRDRARKLSTFFCCIHKLKVPVACAQPVSCALHSGCLYPIHPVLKHHILHLLNQKGRGEPMGQLYGAKWVRICRMTVNQNGTAEWISPAKETQPILNRCEMKVPYTKSLSYFASQKVNLSTSWIRGCEATELNKLPLKISTDRSGVSSW